MNPERRDLLLTMLAASAGVLASACTSLVSRPAPVKAMFLLDPPLPQAAATPSKAAVLRIGTINVAAPFRGKNLVFRRSDLSYEADYYDEFFVPPSMMLADAIAKGLAAANVFQRVVPAGAAGNEGDYLLDGFVSELYGDARSAGAAAVLAITFYLTPMANVGGAPAWTHAYSQREDVGAPTAQALADGLNRALGTILRDLARDLAAATLPTP
ncbi:MAG TPA: ABC-type transport auxiliary lipoprotein family protein [Casimicrobiaceae bacterium]|nr:ABC-type transport auxiliary lipoprotein family protein [Casimicrobiaceae bacterium]